MENNAITTVSDLIRTANDNHPTDTNAVVAAVTKAMRKHKQKDDMQELLISAGIKLLLNGIRSETKFKPTPVDGVTTFVSQSSTKGHSTIRRDAAKTTEQREDTRDDIIETILDEVYGSNGYRMSIGNATKPVLRHWAKIEGKQAIGHTRNYDLFTAIANRLPDDTTTVVESMNADDILSIKGKTHAVAKGETHAAA